MSGIGAPVEPNPWPPIGLNAAAADCFELRGNFATTFNDVAFTTFATTFTDVAFTTFAMFY